MGLNVPFVLRTVAATRFLSFTSRSTLSRVGAELQVAELPVAGISWRRWMGVVYRNDAYTSPVCRRFIDILKEIGRNM